MTQTEDASKRSAGDDLQIAGDRQMYAVSRFLMVIVPLAVLAPLDTKTLTIGAGPRFGWPELALIQVLCTAPLALLCGKALVRLFPGVSRFHLLLVACWSWVIVLLVLFADANLATVLMQALSRDDNWRSRPRSWATIFDGAFASAMIDRFVRTLFLTAPLGVVAAGYARSLPGEDESPSPCSTMRRWVMATVLAIFLPGAYGHYLAERETPMTEEFVRHDRVFRAWLSCWRLAEAGSGRPPLVRGQVERWTPTLLYSKLDSRLNSIERSLEEVKSPEAIGRKRPGGMRHGDRIVASPGEGSSNSNLSLSERLVKARDELSAELLGKAGAAAAQQAAREPAAAILLGQVCLRQERVSEAELALAKARELLASRQASEQPTWLVARDVMEAYWYSAEAAIRRGDPARAIELLDRGRDRLEEISPELALLRSRGLADQGRSREALEEAERAIRMLDARPGIAAGDIDAPLLPVEAQLNLADVLQQSGQFAGAGQAAEGALKLLGSLSEEIRRDPQSTNWLVRGRVAQARALFARRLLDQAAEEIDRTVESIEEKLERKHPDRRASEPFAAAYFLQRDIALARGQGEQGERFLEEHLGDFARAESRPVWRASRRVADFGGFAGRLEIEAARVYWRCGNRSATLERVARAVELDPLLAPEGAALRELRSWRNDAAGMSLGFAASR